MAGKWSHAKQAKETEGKATEERKGMVSEAEKYEKRHGRGKSKPQTRGGKQAAQPKPAQTEPIDVPATASQPKQQAARPTEPEKKPAGAKPAEPEKKAAAKQQPPAEPEKKATKSEPKQQPEQEAEIGSLVWMGGVDQCVKLLTQKTLSHDKVLEDHEQRIRKLERWKEKDDTFAKKAIPIISELQRDSELSEERLEDLENQFWTLWADHFGVTSDAGDTKAPAADDDEVKDVEDLIALEAASKVEAKPRLDPQIVPTPEPEPKPVFEPKPVAKQAEGKPRRVYRYWDVETKTYWLTLDIWEAKAADDAYQPLWAWCVDDQIDHVMSPWEVRKYRPGTKADE